MPHSVRYSILERRTKYIKKVNEQIVREKGNLNYKPNIKKACMHLLYVSLKLPEQDKK